jgi:hypothetical protein
MAKSTINRRTLLKGIAAGGATVAIGLPTLDIFCNANGTALAQGSPFPLRFGTWIWGNGNIPERWTPRSLGRNYDLSTQLSGLLPVRSDVTVITGTIASSVAREPHIRWVGFVPGRDADPRHGATRDPRAHHRRDRAGRHRRSDRLPLDPGRRRARPRQQHGQRERPGK